MRKRFIAERVFLSKLTQAIKELTPTRQIVILGIESSCDDTSAAVLVDDKIHANITADQAFHRNFGGVVPEAASRAHQRDILPVVEAALAEAKIDKSQLDAIAYTRGPGLLGSLLVGSSFAKSLAQALGVPAIPIHHIRAHVLAHFIDTGASKPSFPFLCLTVSGGHTLILKVDSPFEYRILGETLDDAAGEAFDKAAKLLGLPYPGGPLIDKLAQSGDPRKFAFTKPKVPGIDLSFSGLKSNIKQFIDRSLKSNPDFIEQHLNDLAASIQFTIVSMLLEQLIFATKHTGIREVALAGGVSANSELRAQLQTHAQKYGWNTYTPPIQYCTDNGAMIAIAGKFALEAGELGALADAAVAKWEIE